MKREVAKESKKKVLLIPSTTSVAGVSVNVLNLARLLRSANLLDTVVCPSSGWLVDKLQDENLPFHILDLSYKVPHAIFSSLKLFHFLRKRKSAQIIHLNGRFPTLIALPSMILLKQRRFVVTVREFANTRSSGLFAWKRRLETLVWKYLCYKISCVSEDLKREVTMQLGEKYASKVMTIKNWIYPQGLNISKTKEKIRERKYDLKIIGIGRLSFEKGFDVLISALSILRSKGYSVLCDIFGDGPEKDKLYTQISKNGLEGRVRLCGVNSEVRSLLPQYDLVIIPSRKESFGLVTLEAYDAGIPVIASNIPGLREIVLPEKTGLVFTPDNTESLAQQIIRLINSPELMNSLIERGREFVKSYFPTKDLLNQYLHFYGVQYGKD